MALLEETRAILADLIAFPTISSDGNLDMIGYLDARLKSLGARTELTYDASGKKANLFATLGPEGDGGIVLSGHTDVVPVAGQDWSSDPFTLTERDGLLFGRGACDMKGFIAAALSVAPQFAQANLRRPLHFAFTYDEETGCLGAPVLVEALRRRGLRPAVAIIGEPTEMRIIEGHKGCYEYSTEFTGLEGHGSQPAAGVNAVEFAIRYAARLMELREEMPGRTPDGSRFEPPWTTLQVGRIDGGVAHNVIPGGCTLDWEMRPVRKSDGEYIKARIEDYTETVLRPAMQAVSANAGIALHVIGEVEGLEPASDSEAIEIVSELTRANTADVVSFGTEAGIFQGLGMSAVVCGPGSIAQAHKPDEFIAPDQLRACLDMLLGLKRKLVG